MDEGHGSAQLWRAITVALTAATIYVCWPLWPALVLALWTATLLRPVLARCERVLGKRHAAATLAILLFLVLIAPVAAVVLGVISGLHDLAQLLRAQESARAALAAVATGSPALELPGDWPAALAWLEKHGAQAALLARNIAGAAVSGVVAAGIFFGGAYVFLVRGSEAWAWIKRHVPLSEPKLERMAAAFQETGRGLLLGVGLTSAVQGVVATLAYLLLGVPRWWVLGPITGLASIVPFVGSALVWGPVAAGLFIGERVIAASTLVVLGVALIGTADNLLAPLFARLGSLHMPTYLLFVALLGGLAAFGPWGAVLGPVIVRLWLEAMALDRAGA